MQRQVYLEMFYFLCKEEKPRTVAQAGINHCDLQRALLSDINLKVKILGMKDCRIADENACKNFSVEDAIKNELIPNMKCKRQGGRVCIYTFIPIFPLKKN